MKSSAIACCFVLLLSVGCEPPAPSKNQVIIDDPLISSTGDVIQYLEAATLRGAVEVIINGHKWCFNHFGLYLPEKQEIISAFEITHETTNDEIIQWIRENDAHWINNQPDPHSSHELFWLIIDELEDLNIPYGVTTIDHQYEFLARLEAVRRK
ncbi:MAG: hypothetical protein NWT02_09845 [Opitutales bacterium]|jgi:hypothetical protein|nr:hypothetical protein [Opitutales bacterium]MDP4645377.1 hypothetical protein [Opitutales bacterium]MDP4777414.1 hypothetical protein [Opitutales bacterium]MDP4882938.1 hypothetical protein [Opitutales bacterium]MDP5080243.1 hypothetical protein [Opitutales bacterium]